MVSSVTSLYISTFLRYPMRKARSVACMSTMGFQSGSKIKTLFAEVKLMPRLPTRVVNKNTLKPSCWCPFSNWLNSLIRSILDFTSTFPSMRRYGMCFIDKICSIMFKTILVCEKMSNLLPFASEFHLSSSWQRMDNLPDWLYYFGSICKQESDELWLVSSKL